MTKLTILIGRFQTFHNAHTEILNRAFINSDHVLVLVGSIDQARTPKNPWTFEERAKIIEDYSERIHGLCSAAVKGIRDYPYDDKAWTENVHHTIDNHIRYTLFLDPKDVEIHLTGSDKDETTFYLKFFPEFTPNFLHEADNVSRHLSATIIREIYFGQTFNDNVLKAEQAALLSQSFVPPETLSFLKEFKLTSEYQQLCQEYDYYANYRKPFKDQKHQPIFQTVDACVVQCNHILLIKRKNLPGKGLWALPGGFVNANEWLLNSCLRELKEETQLDVSDERLRSSLIFNKVFDHPGRSLRGRVITNTYLFNLGDDFANQTLAKIEGADDAEKAMWVPIGEIIRGHPEKFFEDHWFAIEQLLEKL
jgi:bifunctional NMN adenylyltransferase/nudix hydrolase